jgi:hypothetical protein
LFQVSTTCHPQVRAIAGPWLWKKADIREEGRLTEIRSKWLKKQKRWNEVRESKLLDEEIEEDRSTRKVDRGQLSKRKNPSVDALENLAGRKERHVGEALKKRVKLT